MPKIADVKTPTDIDGEDAPKTTYTVGRASCEPPTAPGLGVPSCSLEVDMRSTRKETLEDIRHAIEPTFQAGVSAENARHGLKDGSNEGISLELMWFGLRPAYVAESVDNAAVHAGLQAGIQLGAIKEPMVGTRSGSLNDNVRRTRASRRISSRWRPRLPARAAMRSGSGEPAARRTRGGPHASRADGRVDRGRVPRRGWHRRATVRRPDWQADARRRPIALEQPV
ncbi:MAG: hypothetical protein R2712_09205 [Vicinamibacterales bacterium]